MTNETLRDYKHASNLYTNNGYESAPKVKYQYYVVFNINDLITLPLLRDLDKRKVNLLVKSVELPKFNISVETKQKYNRKKNIQTRIDYEPVSIRFHDDRNNAVTRLWESYYKYYFVDGNQNTAAYTKLSSDSTYKSSERNKFRFGLDNGSNTPFFTSIQIYQLANGRYTEFTLVNPIITSWSHDTMDQTAGADIVENACTIGYEAVFYNEGITSDDKPINALRDSYDRYIPNSSNTTAIPRSQPLVRGNSSGSFSNVSNASSLTRSPGLPGNSTNLFSNDNIRSTTPASNTLEDTTEARQPSTAAANSNSTSSSGTIRGYSRAAVQDTPEWQSAYQEELQDTPGYPDNVKRSLDNAAARRADLIYQSGLVDGTITAPSGSGITVE